MPLRIIFEWHELKLLVKKKRVDFYYDSKRNYRLWT